jgi:hypothetical protein
MNRAKFLLALLIISFPVHASDLERAFIRDSYTAALWHMDVIQQNITPDYSVNGNNGTPSGVTLVTGRFGSALHFNGQSSMIEVPDALNGCLDFSASQSFTVEVWFRTISSATQTILRKGLAPVPGYLVQMIGGKVVGNVGNKPDGTPYVIQSANRYDDGVWHRAALVVDRRLNAMLLLVDDQLTQLSMAEISPFSVANDRKLTIGRWENPEWPYYFNGDIDEVRISPIARYAVSDTVACWRLDEASSSLVLDSSPYGNFGTATGTTIVAGEGTGHARKFNGAGDYVWINDPGNGIWGFSATESFTIGVSFKTTFPGSQSMIRHGLAPVPGYLIQMIDGHVVGNVGNKVDGTPYVFQSTKQYNDGLWHDAFMVADRDQGKLFLYVDGELAAPTVADVSPFAVYDDRPFTFGRWENPDWPYYYTGSLDNVMILRGAHHPSASNQARISITPDTLNFGSVAVGTVATLPMTFMNLSTGENLSVTLQSTNQHFQLLTAGMQIVPGGSELLTVRYVPDAVGLDTASLIVNSNDPHQAIIKIPLTGTGSSGGTPVPKGSLAVAVYEAEDWGQPKTAARVVLYSNAGIPLLEKNADINSIARFDSIPPGNDYYYRVYVATKTPWGEVFAGEKTGIAIVGNQVTRDTLKHNTPYCPEVKVYIDNTNEFLPDSALRTVFPGTRLRIELKIKNPNYPGARAATSYGVIRLDRDRAEPYDIGLSSSTRTMGIGEVVTVVCYCLPATEGDYYLTVGAYSSSDRYSATLTDASGWHDPAFRVLPQSATTPPWKYTNTGLSHTVIVPTSANIGVDGVKLFDGDYLGVFYDSSGVLKCGGYEQWKGADGIAVAAFGDDPTTPGKDGFAQGEIFKWKIFSGNGGGIADVGAVFSQPAGIVTHTNAYASNGISKVLYLTGPTSSGCVVLRAGWGLIAASVEPAVTILDSIFKPVLNDLIILKNGAQKSYIPSLPLNTIGVWSITEGYQIKMLNARTLCLVGQKIVPSAHPVAVPAGWSILPYFRESEMPVATALNGLTADIILLKDQDGRTFIPSAGVDLIGNLQPGQGYQVKMANARSFEYPSAIVGLKPPQAANSSEVLGKQNTGSAWWSFINTGINHTIIIPSSINPTIPGGPLVPGDYIGVFYDSSGTLTCAGFTEWTGTSTLAVAAFGDDPTTVAKDGLAAGEAIQWKIWRQSEGRAYVAHASYAAVGSMGGIVADAGAFAANGISALTSLTGVTGVGGDAAPRAFALEQNYPNPFNPSTNIRYALSQSGQVRLNVLNTLGQEVAVLVTGYQGPGVYTVKFDATGLASGVYFYRLKAGEFTETKRLTLIR